MIPLEREEPGASLLRGLSPREVRAVLSSAVARRLAKGQVLFLQDEPAQALYRVEAGRLRLSQLAADGQAVTVRLIGPGEVCAAMAVLDGKAYPFSALAVTPSRVLGWTRSALSELRRTCPRLDRNIQEIVGAHARELLDKVRELATEPVTQRLARALLRLVRLGSRRQQGGILIERVRQQDLAELTAASLYTVNRVLSEWEACGVLKRERGRVLILSEGQLRSIAERS
jgi:CRP-like cAMP-binding protein